MAKILIVGYGYIGKPLAKLLASNDNEVWAISRSNAEHIEGVHHIKEDLFQIETLPPVDAVIYLVSADSHSEQDYVKAYVDGPKHIWSLFKDKKPYRFLFASSTAVYPFNDGRWADEDTELPDATEFNGHILQHAEKHVLNFDCHSICMRIGGIYGPNRHYLVNQLREGTFHPTDHPVYSNRIHQYDCVHAIAHIMDHLAPETIYNLVDHAPTPINEIIAWIQATLGFHSPIPSKTLTPKQYTTNKRVNNQKLLLLRYQFKYPSYREGLSEIFSK